MKLFATAFSILLIGAVLSPVVKNFEKKPTDSFPLSHYPMFSKKRPEVQGVTYLLGLDANGNRHRVPYTYAGSGGLNQVRKQITKKLKKKDQRENFCREIASRLAAHPLAPGLSLAQIQIVTGKYRLNDYFAGNKTPLSERVLVSCVASSREGSEE